MDTWDVLVQKYSVAEIAAFESGGVSFVVLEDCHGVERTLPATSPLVAAVRRAEAR